MVNDKHSYCYSVVLVLSCKLTNSLGVATSTTHGCENYKLTPLRLSNNIFDSYFQ